MSYTQSTQPSHSESESANSGVRSPDPPVEDFIAFVEHSTDRSLVETVRRLASRLKTKTRECAELKERVKHLTRQRDAATELAEETLARHERLLEMLGAIETELRDEHLR